MSVGKHNDLVDLQARVIIIKSYVQFILLESATMPQYHDLMLAHLAKLQMQVRELEMLTDQLCDATRPGSEQRLPAAS